MFNIIDTIFLAMSFVKFNDKGQVEMGSAGFISIFSMAVVFIVLLIISYLIDILHLVLFRNKNEVKEKKFQSTENLKSPNGKTDDALVAIIAAAVAATLNTSVDNIKICSIRRVPQESTSWATKGLIKQVTNK